MQRKHSKRNVVILMMFSLLPACYVGCKDQKGENQRPRPPAATTLPSGFTFPWYSVHVKYENDQLYEYAVENETVTESDVERLKSFSQLKFVRFQLCRLPDDAARAVGGLKIEALDLAQAEVETADFRFLGQMTDLVALSLKRITISEDTFNEILKCRKLKLLDVSFTNLTSQQVEILRKALPNAQIYAAGIE